MTEAIVAWLLKVHLHVWFQRPISDQASAFIVIQLFFFLYKRTSLMDLRVNEPLGGVRTNFVYFQIVQGTKASKASLTGIFANVNCSLLTPFWKLDRFILKLHFIVYSKTVYLTKWSDLTSHRLRQVMISMVFFKNSTWDWFLGVW